MRYLIALMLFVSAPSLVAGELYGVKFDDKIKVDGKELVLNGMGLRSVQRFGLKIKVYVIGLYTPEKMWNAKQVHDAEGPRVFKMVFKRNVDSEDIENGWKEAYKKNCGNVCLENEPKIKEFNDLMSDMRTGKAITVTTYKDKVKVDVNGRKPKKGEIEGVEFARIIEKIWLGVPPNNELKEGILAEAPQKPVKPAETKKRESKMKD